MTSSRSLLRRQYNRDLLVLKCPIRCGRFQQCGSDFEQGDAQFRKQGDAQFQCRTLCWCRGTMLLRAFKPGMMVGMMRDMGGKGTFMGTPLMSMTAGLQIAVQGMIGGHGRATPGIPVDRPQLGVICGGMPSRGGPSGTGGIPMLPPIFFAFLCGIFGRPAASHCMEVDEEMGTLLRSYGFGRGEHCNITVFPRNSWGFLGPPALHSLYFPRDLVGAPCNITTPALSP